MAALADTNSSKDPKAHASKQTDENAGNLNANLGGKKRQWTVPTSEEPTQKTKEPE